jgi:hypothetical protein
VGRLKYLAALPIAHVIACYVYLYLLYAGFGANVVQFASLDNVFAVGLSKLLPFYVAIGAYSIIAHLYVTDEPLKVTDRQAFDAHPSLRGNSFKILFFYALPITGAISVAALYFINNEINIGGLSLMLVVPASLLLARIFEINKIRPIFWSLIWLAVYASFLLVAWSYRDGFHYRHSSIQEFSGDHPKCGEFIILFPVGEYLLASKESGERHIISTECEALFSIPNSKVIVGIR